MSNYKIDLLEAKNWDVLPNPWKVVKKVSKVDVKYTLTDKGLISLFEDFFNEDSLRPAQNGLYVDSKSLVATDSHKLLHLVNKGIDEEGVFIVSPRISKKTKRKIGKTSDKFPDFKVILNNESELLFDIDLRKLKTYCEAVIKGKYCNETTKNITFLVERGVPSKKISFNAEFLLQVLETFMKLGHNWIVGGYRGDNRGVYFSNERDVAYAPQKYVGKANFALLMPMMPYNQSEEFLGSTNQDFDTNISCYYSFEDNEIHNSDGSVAYFDYNLTSKELPYISELHLSMLKRIAGNNSKVPILDNILVKDNIAIANDFKQLISIGNIQVEDGVYEILSGAFKNTTYQISNFPDKITSYTFNFIGSVDNFELGNILGYAKDFVGDDDLRPAQQGIGYVFENGVLNVYATNSHILYKQRMSNLGIKDINNVLMNPKDQAYFLSNMEGEGLCRVFTTEQNDFYSFEKEFIKYITKAESAKPPKYSQAIYSDTDMVLALDKSAILQTINRLKGEDAKSNITLKFDVDVEKKQSASGKLKLYTSENYQGKTTLKTDLKQDIFYDFFEYDREWSEVSLAIIMPIISEDKDSITFNQKLLSTILSLPQSTHNIFFKSGRNGGQFIVKLLVNKTPSASPKPVTPKKVTTTPQPTPPNPQPKVQSKEDIEKIIKGLEVLVKLGNVSAEQKIKGYKIILKLK